MSLPKRKIELPPTTTLAEVVRLMDEDASDVEVRVSGRVLAFHQIEPAISEPSELPAPDAIDNFLKFAGMWEGISEIDTYLESREARRRLDLERSERLRR